MKVFISWSGDHARKVAELLKKHIERVNQRVQVFVSSESIGPGTVWFEVIMHELDETSYGIVCVTKSHINRPWLLFEAGAMAAKFKKDGVVPLLVDAKNSDLNDSPLKHFNAVDLERDKIHRIHHAINERMANDDKGNLEKGRLDESFESDWPSFKEAVDAIKMSEDQRTPDGSSAESDRRDGTLDEILGLVRRIDRSTARRASDDFINPTRS